jgi:hypothetical protein
MFVERLDHVKVKSSINYENFCDEAKARNHFRYVGAQTEAKNAKSLFEYDE